MAVRELKKGVFAIGVNHWDRKLFDELIPLPDGTSYNSYLIRGSEKTAIIDSADPELQAEYLENIREMKCKKIDYIIANHAEQDHSGSLSELIRLFPEARIVTNEKCKSFLQDLLLLPENVFLAVKDRETLSLGDKTLEFIIAPWVHWPETMLTYLQEDRILFSCDLFGSHLATSDLYAVDENKVYEAAKRYYAEIMMPFRTMIRSHCQKIDELKIDLIPPSHGPVYNKPGFILDAYKDWISDDVKNEIILPYVSMHGSTRKIVEYFIDALVKRGLKVKPYNLIETDIGQLAVSLVDAATIIMATPTVLAGPHPAAVYAAYLINALRPKTRFVSVIGSYGWGGKTIDTIKSLLAGLKVEYIDPFIIKGHPKKEDWTALDQLADAVLIKHREIHLL